MMIHVLCMGCGHSTKSGNNQESSPAAARAGDRQSETSHSGAIPYVGSAACVECHSETADEYQSHPMSRSLASTLNAEPVEDMLLPRFSTVPELAYLVEQDKDHTWHHEIRLDEAKNVVYDQRVRMDYTVGSGARGRSYLTNSDGRLYQSPITWYAGGNN